MSLTEDDWTCGVWWGGACLGSEGRVTRKGQRRVSRADNTGADFELFAWSITPYLEGCPQDLKSVSGSCLSAVSRKATGCYICGCLVYCVDFYVQNNEMSYYPNFSFAS